MAERLLGRGGMGTVQLARDTALDRLVALKVLAPQLADDNDVRERFLREARLAARFTHPNVVQIYDVGENELGPYMVMEYVDGTTLADELERRGCLPPAEVIAVGMQICAALEAAHAAGLVHRDIKPQNILRSPNGSVKIADFGIARSLDATRHTEIGTVLGTAAYLAPEQARGEEVTAAADIYSLGVVLYELLTGQPPFTGTTLTELLVKKERGDAIAPRALVPATPPALEHTILRCLAPRAADRPASAAEIARELRGEGVTAATAVIPRRRPQRSRGFVLAAAAAITLALVGLGFALAGHGSPHAPAATPPTTTAPTTTTTPTTTAAPPATPNGEVAAARVAIANAAGSGQLDPAAAADLSNRLDDLEQALQTGNTTDAANKLSDLMSRVAALSSDGELTAIQAPLSQLATMLPASPAPPPPHDHGKHKGEGGDGG